MEITFLGIADPAVQTGKLTVISDDSGNSPSISLTSLAAAQTTLNFTQTGTGTVKCQEGTQTPVDCATGQAYSQNAELTLTATPAATTDTIIWTGCDSTSGRTDNICSLETGTATEKNISVEFTSGNQAPVIDGMTITPDTINAGDTLTLKANATDADTGDVLTYVWSISGQEVANGKDASYTTSATAQATTYTIMLTVEDGKGGSTTDSKDVIINSTVIVNQPPVINSSSATPSNVAVGDTMSLQANASDADNDALTYTWSIDGVGEIANGNSASYLIPTDMSAGTYSVILTVSDGKGNAVDSNHTVIVGATGVELYPLSPVFSLSSTGESATSSTPFSGGVSVDGGASYQADNQSLTASQTLTVSGALTPETGDAGKTADILVVGLHVPLDDMTQGDNCNPSLGDYYMLTGNDSNDYTDNYCGWDVKSGEQWDGICNPSPDNQRRVAPAVDSYWTRWSAKLGDLLPLTKVQLTTESMIFDGTHGLPVLYEDMLGNYTGHVCITFGYRLTEKDSNNNPQDNAGKIVFNGEPIRFQVK
ncbi:Chitinase A precursor [Candidatus Venteria ishoeyi]|uniref:Chitinase A n=1 Tax=Candidatus Venteria ishoeyi TaxID=1899563 RepID=A0A1H6F779_9GAMM|nr:Chitinase A precursor [Candidatus Venteria ishoeyi]